MDRWKPPNGGRRFNGGRRRTYTTFKPDPQHEAAINTMLDQVVAWAAR